MGARLVSFHPFDPSGRPAASPMAADQPEASTRFADQQSLRHQRETPSSGAPAAESSRGWPQERATTR